MTTEPKSFADWLESQPDDDLSAQPVEAGGIPAPVAAEPVFAERCPKCNGSGMWRGYTGRGGRCFTCKGKGQREFKTSPEARAKSRENAAARKVRAADEWKAANPDAWRWIANRSASFGFAASMSQAIDKYGHLTDGQLAAVERCIVSDATKAERDEARRQQWEAERLAREAAAPVVSVAAIETAFSNAYGNGVKWPKLRLDTFVFSPAGANSKNAGAIYIKEGSTYLGKVMDGKFQRVRDCDDATETRIVAVCADPNAAAIAYGRRFGSCCVCGRELTNKASIDAGIGPICAGRFGFAY